MTKKEELKRLKRKIETKVYIEDAYSGSEGISFYEIEQKIDTMGAIKNISKYFESIIMYFSTRGIKYEEITLRGLFSVIVKEKDLSDKTIIKVNSKPLPGIAVVRINGFYCVDGCEKIQENPDVVYDENYKEYVISLEEFIKALDSLGFNYNGVRTTDELKELIVKGIPTFGDITLTFSKKKIKSK